MSNKDNNAPSFKFNPNKQEFKPQNNFFKTDQSLQEPPVFTYAKKNNKEEQSSTLNSNPFGNVNDANEIKSFVPSTTYFKTSPDNVAKIPEFKPKNGKSFNTNNIEPFKPDALNMGMLKQLEKAIEEEKKVTVTPEAYRYSMKDMLEMKSKFMERPSSMKQIEFVVRENIYVKKNKRNEAEYNFRANPASKFDQFNENVKELRNQLNKLSETNFDKISKKITGNFTYTPALLKELNKIIHFKATTESDYLELYVRLCITLFKKFDKKEKDMNFKKLLLRKCQDGFYQLNDPEEDFSRQYLLVFDKEEIEFRKKQKLFGNMKLIGELFCIGKISDKIIMECINFLFNEVNEKNTEILCHLLKKVGQFLYSNFNNKKPSASSKLKHVKELSREKLDQYFMDLNDLRSSKELTSRIKFMIQDLIELREREWLSTHKYVSRGGEDTKTGFKYVRKESVNMYPDENNVSSDEEYKKDVVRKKSINEVNVLGLNLELYGSFKPSQSIRLNIINFMNEYLDSGKINEAAQNFTDTMQEIEDLECFVFIGYLLQHSFSLNKSDFEKIKELIFVLLERSIATNKDIIEGLNVSLCSLVDSIIDYPNSKEYLLSYLDKLKEKQILSEKSAENYKRHIKTIEENNIDF